MVYSSMKVKRLVTVRNDGLDTLHITNVSTSCGCTAALLSRPNLAPHDSGTIEIAFDPRKFSGKVEKAVSMKTNDPKAPNPHIYLKVTIAKILAVEPEYVIIRASAGAPAAAHFTLTNVSQEPVTILSVTSPSGLVAFGAFEKVIKPGQPLEVSMTFTATKTGAQSGDIVVATDNPNIPTIPLRFFALVADGGATPDSGK
jgi:hypothetical protein